MQRVRYQILGLLLASLIFTRKQAKYVSARCQHFQLHAFIQQYNSLLQQISINYSYIYKLDLGNELESIQIITQLQNPIFLLLQNNHFFLDLFRQQRKKMGNCKIPSSRYHHQDQKTMKRAPKRHIVVYVGEELARFVVPISCLKNPQFQKLLEEAAEVYGYHSRGGIILPCSESTFNSVLNELQR